MVVACCQCPFHGKIVARDEQGFEADKQTSSVAYQSSGSSLTVFLARDVIYTSRAYATMSVSVCLSVCLSVMEMHWRIIANLG